MPISPLPGRRLTPAEATAIARRGRKLLRAGRITHRQLVLLDCLLWSCRNPTTGAIAVSYSALQRLAHVSRETIAAALSVLERLGVLSRIKRRVRIAAWHQGGVQSRQATNCYLLHPHHEFAAATVNQSERIEILYVQAAAGADTAAARAALDRRRDVIERKLLAKWRGGPVPAI